MPGKNILHHVRRLGAVVHRERMLCRVVVGQNGTRLVGHAGVTAEVVGFFHHHLGFGKGFCKALGFQGAGEANVVAQIGMDDDVPPLRGLHVGDGGQRLPLDLHMVQRIFCLSAGFGDDGDHRLALPAHAVNGQRMLWRRLDAFQMPENAHPGRAKLGHSTTVHHGNDAGLLARLGQVHLGDFGVGMRAAIERHMGQARHTHIVEVGATSLQKFFGPRARDALAHKAGLNLAAIGLQWQFGTCIHDAAPCVKRCGGSARWAFSTVSIASTIAW